MFLRMDGQTICVDMYYRWDRQTDNFGAYYAHNMQSMAYYAKTGVLLHIFILHICQLSYHELGQVQQW